MVDLGPVAPLSDRELALAHFAPVGTVRRMSLDQIVPVDVPAGLDRIEADMVARLARAAHQAGRRFVGWPTFSRTFLRDAETLDEALMTAEGAPACEEDDERARHVRLYAEVAVVDRE